MKVGSIIVIFLLSLIFIKIYGLGPAVHGFFTALLSLPEFRGMSNSAIFHLAKIMILFIVLIAIIKMVISKNDSD